MKLRNYKIIFVAIGLVGILLIASPTIGVIINVQSEQKFSEIYLLGPSRMAENYPHNVALGENYSIYVGVGNHLGSSAYYVVFVKLRNQTDKLPNVTDSVPSSLPPLSEYRFVLEDGEVRETSLTFSLSDVSFYGEEALVQKVAINGVSGDFLKPVEWNEINSNYFCQLVFELWRYDERTGSIRFDNRFVSLQLNLTKTS